VGDFERILVPWIEELHVPYIQMIRVALVRLCQTAFDLELDVLTTPDD